jgi:hypothetical protein
MKSIKECMDIKCGLMVWNKPRPMMFLYKFLDYYQNILERTPKVIILGQCN